MITLRLVNGKMALNPDLTKKVQEVLFITKLKYNRPSILMMLQWQKLIAKKPLESTLMRN